MSYESKVKEIVTRVMKRESYGLTLQQVTEKVNNEMPELCVYSKDVKESLLNISNVREIYGYYYYKED